VTVSDLRTDHERRRSGLAGSRPGGPHVRGLRGRGGTAALTALVLAALAAGCTSGFTSPRSLRYAPATGVELARMQEGEDGLLFEDLSRGWGEEVVGHGDRVRIHYLGMFPDGRKFDSSLDRREPIEFRVGDRSVIIGWEEGVKGMRVGGRRRLVVPPELAYGATGLEGVVPPDQVLVFEIQLLDMNW